MPLDELEAIELTVDEFEAIRLADFEGLYQEEAAGRMHVSRQTFGNILSSARHKVGVMLVTGKQLTITGGTIMMTEQRLFKCGGCGHAWAVGHGVQRPEVCPSCGSENIHRSSPGGGFGGGRGGGGRCRGLRTGLHREGRVWVRVVAVCMSTITIMIIPITVEMVAPVLLKERIDESCYSS